MIKVGTVEGVQEKISLLKTILSGLGKKGSLSLSCDSGEKRIQITDSVALVFYAPLTIDFEITDSEITIKFREPHPTGVFKIIKLGMSGVTISTSRITIGLDWVPDVYAEIKS